MKFTEDELDIIATCILSATQSIELHRKRNPNYIESYESKEFYSDAANIKNRIDKHQGIEEWY